MWNAPEKTQNLGTLIEVFHPKKSSDPPTQNEVKLDQHLSYRKTHHLTAAAAEKWKFLQRKILSSGNRPPMSWYTFHTFDEWLQGAI